MTGKKLLIVRSRLPAQHSNPARQYWDSLSGTIALKFLSAYTLQMNPLERIWEHLKHHNIPNYRTTGCAYRRCESTYL
jgi:hypothetical protein